MRLARNRNNCKYFQDTKATTKKQRWKDSCGLGHPMCLVASSGATKQQRYYSKIKLTFHLKDGKITPYCIPLAFRYA